MKKYISVLFIVFAITSSGCKKNYLELSTNPNLPIAVTPGLLLSGALAGTASVLNGYTKANSGNYYTSYTMYACWIGYLSNSPGGGALQLVQYAFISSNFDMWTKIYLNLSNYNALGKSTTEPYYLAIDKIMLAFNFEQLVDNYNDVPYTEAFSASLTPKYDKGSAIYDDLLKQLDAAMVMIQNAPASATNPGTSDIMYGGNMQNWLKFANTLKLRIAIRQSNLTAKAAILKSAVAATSAIGYLDSTNPATVNPGYLDSDANGGEQSPLWMNYGYTQSGSAQTNNSSYMANSYGVNFYLNHNDPRAKQVYAVNPSGNLVADPFGATVTTPAGLTPSRVGPGVLQSPTMNAIIMSAPEALFLQAEAASTGLISGNAQTLYNAGITASFENLLVTNPDAAALAYYTQPNIAFPVAGTPAQQQKAIIVQKWAALNPYGALEAFNEFRRTGYPDDIPLSVYPGANAPNQITRLYYPASEYQTNAANVGAEGTIDKFSSKIFWAK
ncbi:SusD/RagB family nutrient-binding outer membrane lipoprotein [Pedobacter sp. L105]|uniref:SusD/RagB family nutrient-binding outer membrane lipoprotein n=1 Tax=Pedobacter sp. L105 TaxID=1641871 RepID=UPI00131A89D3|nr:SusD/RagB family nutrient-binding outer membrane lipoprotein [Pedobacter sp. L105]